MGSSYKPILALLGVIHGTYLIGSLVSRLQRQAGMMFRFSPHLAISLLLTLLLGSLLLLLVAYLWSRPVDHRPAAWVFLIAGCVLLIYPVLRLSGQFLWLSSGPFLFSWAEIFFPGSMGSLSAAVIATAGLLHLLRGR